MRLGRKYDGSKLGSAMEKDRRKSVLYGLGV